MFYLSRPFHSHHFVSMLLPCLLFTPLPTSSKPIAVVHVGPHKTGTTSIQSSTKVYKESFREDQYFIVDKDPLAGLKHLGKQKPTRAIAKCAYINDASCAEEIVDCDEGHFQNIQRVLLDPNNTIRTYNLVFSQEGLDGMCVDGGKVRALLDDGWDVRIVVGYRRFFEWVGSYYFQQHRDDEGRQRNLTWPKKNDAAVVDNIKSWWTPQYMEEQYTTRSYTTAVLKRYEKVFDDVSILNLHDDVELVENFFCHQIPNATNACRSLRDHTEAKQPDENRGGSTAYDELAMAAYLGGFISGKEISRQELRGMIKKRQEDILGLTADDFPKDCLSQGVLDRLLELSLLAEESVVPSFFAGPRGERELRKNFEEAATTELCAVDTAKVLMNLGWIEFFRDIKSSGSFSAEYCIGAGLSIIISVLALVTAISAKRESTPTTQSLEAIALIKASAQPQQNPFKPRTKTKSIWKE